MSFGKRSVLTLCALLLLGCSGGTTGAGSKPVPENTKVATLAGGCFWCVEAGLEKAPGVVEVISGFTGGDEPNPTYEDVSAKKTGHLEAVQVRYDPAVIDFDRLLDYFWHRIDPTDPGGQFADRGHQYSTAIFYHDEEQRRIAEESKNRLDRSGKFESKVVTKIRPAGPFYPAEEYHQDYYKKHPAEYEAYYVGSGRAGYVKKVWGGAPTAEEHGWNRPDDGKIREMLTPLQYQVTQESGTERAFDNEYWDSKAAGIYVDVVSGEPLFSSTDKYDSGSGWPSFTRPLESRFLVEKSDLDLGYSRTELRSRHGDSHLGHVFDDGPEPTGLRYCINSAALRFVPVEDLEKEGYGAYRELFEEQGEEK